MKKILKDKNIYLIIPFLIGVLNSSFNLNAEETDIKINNNLVSPDVQLGPLFDVVQKAHLYADQKTFADAVPKRDPISILTDWQMQKNQSNFDLKSFIKTNFTFSNNEEKKYIPPANQSLREHINNLWSVLTRTTNQTKKYDSLLPLPKSYVVPGGRFSEIYYWDSYFTMLGLAESNLWDTVENMVDNFAWEIDRYGHIPNGNRTYYLSRSQPPFFSMMIDLLANHHGNHIYTKYLPQLQKEYSYWMEGLDSNTLKIGNAIKNVVKLKDGSILNRYWDTLNIPRTESYMDDIITAHKNPWRNKSDLYRDLRSAAASGWDFSSRWCEKPNELGTIRTTNIIPIDLNVLIMHLEQTLAKANTFLKNTKKKDYFTELATKRQKAINKYLWDKKNGWYADYDWRKNSIRPQLTAAALFPLYLHVATNRQANLTANAVKKYLLKAGGILTTKIISGQQWDAPNGWAPLQWIAVKGLNNYKHHTLAKEIGLRFLKNVQKTYDKEHKLVEKYIVDGTTQELGGGNGGEYPLQDGFGWTNAVVLKLMNLYCPKDITCNNVSDMNIKISK